MPQKGIRRAYVGYIGGNGKDNGSCRSVPRGLGSLVWCFGFWVQGLKLRVFGLEFVLRLSRVQD